MQSKVNDIEVIPYLCVDGNWNMNDSIIEWCWFQMVRDNTVRRVFNEKEVVCLQGFIDFIRSRNSFVVFTDKPVGMAWLDPFNMGSVWANFCVFSHAWGRLAVEIGKKTLAYWYGLEIKPGEPLFRSIAGITPSNNVPALRYIRLLDGKIIGRIPDAIYDAYEDRAVDAVISYFERG